MRLGVEVILPVLPDAVRVALERWARDPGAGQRRLGLARVEDRPGVDRRQHLRRDAELGQESPRQAAHRVRQPLTHQVRQDRPQVGDAEPQGEPGRARRRAEDVERLARGGRPVADQVERLAVEARRVRQVVDRRRHEVDRHDGQDAALEADERHPVRQQVAQLADQGEEVVRAVDLVHDAGARIADDDPGPVDAKGQVADRAHQGLGAEPRLDEGTIERLALVEHVLGEAPGIPAGHDGRAQEVEA